MAHDGQDLQMKPTLIPDLLALTGATLEPLDQLLEAARASVKEMVSSEGRVSGKLIEENQVAAHGLSWLATYVYSLRQMQKWAEKLQAEGKFGEMDQLLHQIGFGEYL
ncbi:MAG: acyl-CoA dehydrogenase, partial [Leisingera sp.]